MNKNKILSILLFLIVASQQIRSQDHELRFRHMTIDDGLSQNKINCIYQDSRGFIWFGTNEGLNKFDGYEFTIFGKGFNDVEKLTDDFIVSIFEDSKANLWIGTGNGLNMYDRVSNQFVHFFCDSISQGQFRYNYIKSIIEDHEQKLWVATQKSIELFDPKTKKITSFIPTHFKDIRDSEIDINIIYEDKQENFWIGTDGAGLGLFNRKTNTFKYYTHDPNNNRSISDNDIVTIYEDSKGNLWVGTYNGGLNLHNSKTNTFSCFLPSSKINESKTIQAISEDNNGNLMLGTRNGLYIFNPESKDFFHSAHDPHNPYSLNQNNIWSIYKDKSGNFWIGTKGGINFLHTTNEPFIHLRADRYNNRHLNNKLINTIFEDSKGNLWFGTEEGGVNYLDRKTGTFKYYIHESSNRASISSNSVSAIVEDSDKNFWIGTHQGGLNFFDQTTKRFTKRATNWKNYINFSSVNSLLLDTKNDIWIGSTQNGLVKYNHKQDRFDRVPVTENQMLPGITCMLQVKNGDIWVGTNKNKFCKINPDNLNCEEYQIAGGTEITIVTDIKEGKDNNLWIGTQGNGLIRFNTIERTFQRYTKKDGLANNHALSILIDDNGDLWIGTYNGLSKFNPLTKQFKNYNKESGLQSNQFTPACLKTRSGELFFGGINGVTAFNPDKIIENSYMPPVLFTDFKIFNKPVKIGGENPVLTKHIVEADEIQLTYKHSIFTFTYAALDFSFNSQTQYAFTLDGFEKEWNYVSNRRFATYSNLGTGTYTFKVKATNNPVKWPDKFSSIKIMITPPFWEEWWFRLIIFIILLLIILHFINHQKQKRDLLKATSLANLTQLKLLRNQMNPHFLLNAFSVIRALVLVDKKKAWKSISELSDYFRYVLLKYNKIEDTLNDEIEAARNYINIQSMLKESLQATFNVDEAARQCIVPAFIFQPLIENAIKYGESDISGKLKINIVLTYHNDTLTIDVSNTGKLKKEKIKIDNAEQAHGNSVINIKKRLEIMFKDNFKFELSEDHKWVHARIIIYYEKSSLQTIQQLNGRNEEANTLVTE